MYNSTMGKDLLKMIGKNIKKFREKENMTQAELGKIVGMEQQNVNKIRERSNKYISIKTSKVCGRARKRYLLVFLSLKIYRPA